MKKIKSIEKGWGQDSIFYSTNENCSDSCRVDEIKEENKIVGFEREFLVYRGYKNGEIVFEIGATPDVTLKF